MFYTNNVLLSTHDVVVNDKYVMWIQIIYFTESKLNKSLGICFEQLETSF